MQTPEEACLTKCNAMAFLFEKMFKKAFRVFHARGTESTVTCFSPCLPFAHVFGKLFNGPRADRVKTECLLAVLLCCWQQRPLTYLNIFPFCLENHFSWVAFLFYFSVGMTIILCQASWHLSNLYVTCLFLPQYPHVKELTLQATDVNSSSSSK